ncbi:FxDxF family PEP-CTERM protein [Thiobacillus sp.]|uniref:FxDxF family PEP-CTERM protein n=1 Tax=Thiobacillus sp. TaxID=924 RepID=UPI0025F1F711|nr:FxDxF family PEP-CTERM protein [Thiobacillus sp.]MBT9538312.1 FxDxF family PEP-CTERM protein [Thiobacillus sp.]
MKSVQTLLAFALIAGMASATAHADATYNMGMLSATPYVNTSTVTAGSVFTIGSNAYNFTDIYNFTVVGAPTAAGTGVTVNLDLGSLGFHISNLKLDLFSGTTVFNPTTWLAGDLVTGSADTSVSVNSVLAAGSYSFLVRGFADGETTNQGIYTFSAAAVPEAEAYGMMLAGLGLVGFMVSRRRGSL